VARGDRRVQIVGTDKSAEQWKTRLALQLFPRHLGALATRWRLALQFCAKLTVLPVQTTAHFHLRRISGKCMRTSWIYYVKRLMVCFVLPAIGVGCFSTIGQSQKAVPVHYDLIVYGGTPAGVIAAIAGARQGLATVLLVCDGHLGGMVSGGLSATDLGNYHVIGGASREFFLKAAQQSGARSLDRSQDWRSEPHVAEGVFRALLKDANVRVQYKSRLREHAGVEKLGTNIAGLVLEDGSSLSAKIYIDASYEGDLLAQAGVSYTTGREAISKYNETLAGVRRETPNHQFQWPIPASDPSGALLPEISTNPLGEQGSGDALVQAYTFRVVLTRRKENRVRFSKPDGYDSGEFRLLGIYLRDYERNIGHPPRLEDLTIPIAIPGDKADFNNKGPFSTDYIGHSVNYPDASYKEQRHIWQQTLVYVQSFFYFLATDKQVPRSLRKQVNEWGLARDEFADSGHWPDQLYIREGRRMIGEHVMTQADLQVDRTKFDSIGMGSYNSDSHNVQRVVRSDGTVMNEGDIQIPVSPYEIPYRMIVPRDTEVTNLLVPVCFSASHVAYSSLRMEPQYMIVGQAAGVAAAVAIRSGQTVQQISISQLQNLLSQDAAILHEPPAM